MHARVSDHAGLNRHSRCRTDSYCLPHTRRTSAPEKRQFRGSMAGLHAPLSTLHAPHGCPRMTRGQCGSLLLHCNGLSPSTPCRFLPAHLVLTPAKEAETTEAAAEAREIPPTPLVLSATRCCSAPKPRRASSFSSFRMTGAAPFARTFGATASSRDANRSSWRRSARCLVPVSQQGQRTRHAKELHLPAF